MVSIYKEVFGNSKLDCNFYTGILVMPLGEIVNYAHMGYSSTYENYNLAEIKNGTLIQSREFSNYEYATFKERQFKAFKKTEAYRKLYQQMEQEFDESNAVIDATLDDTDVSKKSKNKYLEEKERNWFKEKEIERFIRLFVVEYSEEILTD